MKHNIHGSSRHIPADVKRKVRRRCCFGCVICGLGIIEYHHADPEFIDVVEHDPDGIVLLCPNHHSELTAGRLSGEFVRQASGSPKACERGWSDRDLLFLPNEPLDVRFGSVRLQRTGELIRIDEECILAVRPPDDESGFPQISARFYDRSGNLVAWIQDNEWHGDSSAFDIEMTGTTTTIRSDSRKIDLKLIIEPPVVAIEQLCLHRNGKTIKGDTDNGFVVATAETEIPFAFRPGIVSEAPYLIAITDNTVSVGNDHLLKLVDADGSKEWLAGTIDADGVRLDHMTYEEAGIPPPPGKKPSDRTTRVTKMTEKGRGAGFGFAIPVRPRPRTPSDPSPPKQKIGRNEPCPCGSGRKYKHCCGSAQ